MRKIRLILTATIGVFVVLVGVVGVSTWVGYNHAAELDESATSSRTAIGIAMQNRYEKMMALVNALQNLEQHVEEQLGKITAARTAYVTALNNKDVESMSETEDTLESEFMALQVIIEDNPDTYVATSAYISYMNEISATTNMVTTARILYNDAVEQFNKNLRAFPNNLILSMFGFERLTYYEAPEHTAGVVLLE
jgi:LemA protein